MQRLVRLPRVPSTFFFAPCNPKVFLAVVQSLAAGVELRRGDLPGSAAFRRAARVRPLRRAVQAGGRRPDALRQVPGARAPRAEEPAARDGSGRLQAGARTGRGPLLAQLAGGGRAGPRHGAETSAPLRSRPEFSAALPRRGAAARRRSGARAAEHRAAGDRRREPGLGFLPRLRERRRSHPGRRVAPARPPPPGSGAGALRAGLRRPGLAAPARAFASRSQAGQRRRGPPAGRHRAGRAARRVHLAPAGARRPARGHAADVAPLLRRVHVARGGQRRQARRAQRPLRGGRAPLPARLGAAAFLCRTERRGASQGAPRARAPAPARRGPQAARRTRRSGRRPATRWR